LLAGVIKILTFDFREGGAGKMRVFDESATVGGEIVLTGIRSSFYDFVNNASNAWAWFFLGGITALVIFLLWNWGNDKGKQNEFLSKN